MFPKPRKRAVGLRYMTSHVYFKEKNWELIFAFIYIYVYIYICIYIQSSGTHWFNINKRIQKNSKLAVFKVSEAKNWKAVRRLRNNSCTPPLPFSLSLLPYTFLL